MTYLTGRYFDYDYRHISICKKCRNSCRKTICCRISVIGIFSKRMINKLENTYTNNVEYTECLTEIWQMQ